MNIKDKVVVITGASSGIGKTTAIRFAEEQAKVVINYLHNDQGAQATLNQVQQHSEGIAIQADVSQYSEIERLCSETEKRFGRVDIFINNAAIPSEKTSFLETSPEEIQAMLSVNLLGPILCSQVALRYMQKQGYGKLLFTGSIRGSAVGGRTVVYSATKAALHNVTQTLAKQYAPKIQVNAVAPGYLKTRFHEHLSAEEEQQYLSQTFIKRWIREEEVADGFIFLTKNDAITGQILYIDGGYTLK
jgi:3-oxoacyl-[acyl-carrier protein] reductase